MNIVIKKVVRRLLPQSVRNVIWSLIPKVFKIHTLLLDNLHQIENKIPISDNYYIKEVTWDDEASLRSFFALKGPHAFDRKVPKRLNSINCQGYAVFDKTSGEIVYNSWVITNYIRLIEEYCKNVISPSLYWESAECRPDHRHQGLHSRLEQEVINYAVTKGALGLYIHIEANRIKGVKHALSQGYYIIDTSYAIFWPIFDIYRNFKSFLKKPFKSIAI